MFGYVEIERPFQIQTLYTYFDVWVDNEYFYAGERHNFWELVVIAQGEVGITAGEDVQILRQGQAVLHEPMEFHRLWYAGGEPARVIGLTFGGVNVPPCGKLFTLSNPQAAVALLEQIDNAFEKDQINIVGMGKDPLRGQILLKELELLLLEAQTRGQPRRSGALSTTAGNYVRMVRLLENHVNANLSVADVARMCNMSTVNAKQTFSRYAGMGIKEYFNRLKIKAAILLLQSGNSVQETADLLGFSSQQYFCTVFRRITGKTPSSCKQPE